ncbi:hypothetical protein BH23ACT9_BH23ACT9_38240 [soil metagenome]
MLGPLDTDLVRHHLVDPPPLPPGTGAPSVSLLVDGLVRAGHHVTMWTLDPRVTEPVVAEGPSLRIWYGRQPARHRGRTLHREERAALVAGMQGAEVDVLHAHWTYEYAWAALGRPEPLLVTARDWPPAIMRLQASPYRAFRMVAAARVFAARPAMTAPSEYLAAKHRRIGLPTTVIPNGIPAASVVAQARDRGEGMDVLSVASGFDNRKNTRSLLRSHALLRRGGLDARLVMIGAGHGPGEQAERWAREHDVHAGVEFRGQIPYPDVLEAMQRSALLVHPSREESYGRVLVEAMAKALPVIGGQRSGAVPWVLDGGQAGVLVDVESPEAIAAATASVLTDDSRWTHLSRVGRDRAATAFTMEPIVGQYVDRYQALIAGA